MQQSPSFSMDTALPRRASEARKASREDLASIQGKSRLRRLLLPSALLLLAAASLAAAVYCVIEFLLAGF